MSKTSIWKRLRAAGLSQTGTAALMGNMMAESAMRSTNVQDGMGYDDDDYTRKVDAGFISRSDFINDQRGYGLCQWTHPARKEALYDFAKLCGCSIGDESMQVDFVCMEFPNIAPQTFAMCCAETESMYTCTEWICKYYESPAVNNVQTRYDFAIAIFEECVLEEADQAGVTSVIISEGVDDTTGEESSFAIVVPRLSYGDKSRAVYLAQCALTDLDYPCGTPDGDFGNKTLAAVQEIKSKIGLADDGTVDGDLWQFFFQ